MIPLGTAVRQFTLWLVVSGIAVGFIVWRYHSGRRFEATIVEQREFTDPERVWFTPEGVPIVADQTPQGLNLVTLETANPNDVVRPQKVAAGIRKNIRYALAPDGQSLVWVSGSSVTVAPLNNERPRKRELPNKSEAQGIAWLDGSLILVLHADGNLDSLDATTLGTRASTATQYPHPSAMAANGTFVAVGSYDRLQIRVFDVRMMPQVSVVETLELRDPFTALAISGYGQVATASRSGVKLDGAVLAGPGKVDVIQFLDPQRLIVSGEAGLRLLGEKGGPMTLAQAPANVRFVEVGEKETAVISGNKVILMVPVATPPISQKGMSILWRWLIATAVIGMFFLVRFLFTRAAAERALDDAAALENWEEDEGSQQPATVVAGAPDHTEEPMLPPVRRTASQGD